MSFGGSGDRYGGFGSDGLYSSSGGGYSGNTGEFGSHNTESTPLCCLLLHGYFTDLVVRLLASDYYNGGGGSSTSFRDDTNRKGYDEYDAGEYEEPPASRRANSLRGPTSPSTSRHPSGSGSSGQPPRIPEDKEKEKGKPVAVDDLLGDWGDDTALGSSSTTTSIHDKALPALVSPGTNDGASTFLIF